MNRIIHKLLVAVLLASLSAVQCVAAEPAAESALKSVLEGRYAALKAAIDARDRQALAALLAPGFASVDVSGKSQTAEQMLTQLAASRKDPNKVSETTLLSVKLNGDVATVSQRYHMTSAKVTSDGSRHPVELVTLSTDTWIRSGDSWLLRQTATDQLDYSVDGKAMPHKVRPPAP
jgi:ketosteroid isomerase-like protein